MTEQSPIVITMGEPAGIGGEIVLKSWAKRKAAALPPFFVIDDLSRLEELSHRLGLRTNFARIENTSEACRHFADALPVFDRPLDTSVTYGQPSTATANRVISSIKEAVGLCASGTAKAVITNPIQKSILYEAGFGHPGHTEFLADLCTAETTSDDPIEPVMMLTVPSLRVVPVTVHIALRDVPMALTTSLIVKTAKTLERALVTDFGFSRPRIAVAGLNPHAGEDGNLGTEEETVIAPAIEQLKAEGCPVTGPFSPDTLFHETARHEYDAVLCMYHDQALIPLKTIDFERGVNATLGLPIIRTSPDHGTALNIAGTGRASPESLIEAIHLANFMAERRQNAQVDG